MTPSEIISERLRRQQLTLPRFTTPHEVVRWMGAIQAQDFQAALWAIGSRLPTASMKDVESSIAAARIVRSWPMRGTLHFVAAEDLRWILRLLAPRVCAGAKGRHRQLELDDKVLATTRRILETHLDKNGPQTRKSLLETLEKKRISTAGQRGAHILQYHALEGLICFATHQGKQPAFALSEEWIGKERRLGPQESLAELTLRYFRSHGPATAEDFAWWSGLRITQVREALSLCEGQLERVRAGKTEYWMAPFPAASPVRVPPLRLLPGFDEYLLGYRDRSLVLEPRLAPRVVPGNNGMFLPTIVKNGRIRGTWKRQIRAGSVNIEVHPFRPEDAPGARPLAAEVKKYKAFWG
jgi:hypothetical protein